ncbi:MAG: nuclear transport factor 2 family protein [Bacteroidetes bacterium]|uniref:nuclear transport factor 2 family protein n=1 Tax=Flavobacterium sp. TaxID=239 RepID=UPI002FDA82EC|nr:nuclear transport factor 2 family protein [Bacteroidota bacterium]
MNQTNLSERDIIVVSEDTILNAMKNCDIKKLDELLHAELLFNIPSGETITKTMDLETYKSGNMNICEIKSSQQIINIIGDNAIVSVCIEMQGKFFDYSLDGKYKVIRIWKKFDEKWKVIGGSSVKI